MDKVELYTAMRELFADPARVCRYHYAEDASGDEVDASDPTAVSWCYLGAMDKFLGHNSGTTEMYPLYLAVKARGYPGPVSFIESPRVEYADIVAAIDEALELARQGA